MKIQNINIRSRILYSNLAIFVSMLIFVVFSAYQIYNDVKIIETLYYDRIIPLQQLAIIQRNMLPIRINMMAEMIAMAQNNPKEVKKRIDFDKKIEELNGKFSKNLVSRKNEFSSMVYNMIQSYTIKWFY